VDARKRIAGLQIAVALLVIAGFAGCARHSTPASSSSVSGSASSSVSATTSVGETSSVKNSTANVDAAGAAIGSKLTVGSANTKPRSGGIPRPSKQTAEEKARTLLLQSGDVLKVQDAAVRSMTQDTGGTWWVLVDVKAKPTGEGQAVLTFDGKRWDVSVFGQGVTDDDLPPDVHF
jgi:hypothetical protein